MVSIKIWTYLLKNFLKSIVSYWIKIKEKFILFFNGSELYRIPAFWKPPENEKEKKKKKRINLWPKSN